MNTMLVTLCLGLLAMALGLFLVGIRLRLLRKHATTIQEAMEMTAQSNKMLLSVVQLLNTKINRVESEVKANTPKEYIN